MQVHIYKSGIKREFRSCSRTTRCRIYNEIIFGCRKALDSGYSYAEIWNGLDEYGNSVKSRFKKSC